MKNITYVPNHLSPEQNRESGKQSRSFSHVENSSCRSKHANGVDIQFYLSSLQLSAASPVIQRVAAQIELDVENRIYQLIINGRPPRVHGRSMGDHTTAFSVHTEGICIALQGKTLAEAYQYFAQLANYFTPEFYPSLDLLEGSELETRFSESLAHFRALLDSCDGMTDVDSQVDRLQQIITAYLETRELIPLSTINVGGAISYGIAGKGHGEHESLLLLSNVERIFMSQPDASLSDENLQQLNEAILGVFDTQAATMVCVAIDEEVLSDLTAGMPLVDASPDERLEMLWQQHINTMQMMFPKVCEQVDIDMLTAQFLENANSFPELFEEEIERQLKQIDTDMENITREVEYIMLSHTRKFTIKYLKDYVALSKSERVLFEGLERTTRIVGILQNLEYDGLSTLCINILAKANNVLTIIQKIHSHLPDSNTISKEELDKFRKNPSNIPLIERFISNPILPSFIQLRDDFQKQMSQIPSNIVSVIMDVASQSTLVGPEEETSEPETPTISNMLPYPQTLGGAAAPMTIQITLTPEKRIAGLITEGRPPSPFRGTMGAHTTAWIVHLDRVRARIIGHDLATAQNNMRLFAENILNQAENVSPDTLGDNAVSLLPVTGGCLKELVERSSTLPPTLSLLQQLIYYSLALFNLLPGVSVWRTNTDGRGEGAARNILLAYEREGETEPDNPESLRQHEMMLLDAIKLLLDSHGKEAKMRHRLYITEAYPRVAAFVYHHEIAARTPLPPEM